MHKPGSSYFHHNLCRHVWSASQVYLYDEGWQSWTRLDGGEWKLAKINPGDTPFNADPFLFRHDGHNWLFYETMTTARKGVIGCFKEVYGEWRQQGVVLDEPWHLSYPQVFEENGHIYMIPESCDHGHGVVALYEPTDFPRGWHRVKTMIPRPYSDCSLLVLDGHYYMACYTNEGHSAELWHADSLCGEWKLHPQSANMNQSRRLRRCGGGWLVEDGHLYRIAQDNNGFYGKRVFKIKVDLISPFEYREGEVSCLAGYDDFIPGRKHTYNVMHYDGHTLEVFDLRTNVFVGVGTVLRRIWRQAARILKGHA